MSFDVVNNGDGTGTATWEVSTNYTKMSTMIDYWAHYLWLTGQYGPQGTEEEPVEWEDVTNGQKLDIVNQRIADVARAEAHAFYINNEQETARLAAIEEANTNINLD